MSVRTRRSINDVLAEAQARLRRLTPAEAALAMREGATLVDTRDGDVRARDGSIPGAVHVSLSVLEWRVIKNRASIPIHGRRSMLAPRVPTPRSGPMRTARRSTVAWA